MIASGVDVIVFLERNDRGRVLKEIAEVGGGDNGEIRLERIF